MDALTCPSVRPEPVPPQHQAFLTVIDGPRVRVEPVQATPNAPLPARFCGLSLDTTEAMGMAAEYFARRYRDYLKRKSDPVWSETKCGDGWSLLDHERRDTARALMAVVAAACTSKESSDLQRMHYARRNLLCRARNARFDLRLRDVGNFLTDAKFTKGHCEWVREVIKRGGVR